MPQVINLLQNGLDALACYLGNDIRMRIEYNGLPDSSIQVGEVSTFELDGEGGAPSTILPKQSLDSLEFDLQEEIEDDLMARSILTGKGERASDSEGENSSTEEEEITTSQGSSDGHFSYLVYGFVKLRGRTLLFFVKVKGHLRSLELKDRKACNHNISR
ncbi:hypothetical protein HOLleu_03845 [Holothuria leucospilota]|uniref:Uncharacterized protein n=1 Tax=Holothuria leucospilota TaxID=206669 RepID=A0A9Q1CTI9_HOLLE|nr:hypothetical protein HOLleu_03845 [Holothuria leucospilota]